MFNQFQVLPLILIVSLYFVRDKRIDSREVIFSRPESNAEYILGTVRGIVREFLILAGAVFFAGALIHLLGTPLPFDIWHYFFYLLTLVVPTLFFVLGLAFWLNNLLRNFAFTLLLLIGSYAFLQLFLLSPLYGVFDPFGTQLPAVFSQVTGLADLPAYLCHRTGWWLVGIGLLWLFIAGYARIPNHARGGSRAALTGGLFCVAGLLLLAGYVGIERKKDTDREKAAAVYDRHAAHPRLTMQGQEITYYQPGNRMEVSTRVTLKNDHPTAVDGVILYLNPGLAVSEITRGGTVLPFEREYQVIRIPGSVGAGAEWQLDIRYAGSIDESVCYLDVENRREQDLQTRVDYVARYGSRYAFLNKEYTLLIPECLWYPVTAPPVNPRSVYDVERQFTHYRLTVREPGDRCPVSLGKRSESADGVLFQPETPLTGITLAMGKYIRRTAEVDGISYELYSFPHSETLVKGWELLRDTIEPLLSAGMKNIEAEKSRDYPFSHLIVAETPLTFATYDRAQKNGNDRQQPGLALLPEKGHGVSALRYNGSPYATEERSLSLFQETAVRFSGVFSALFNTDFSSNFGSEHMFLRKYLGNAGSFVVRDNPYALSRSFFYYTGALYSPAYPILDAIVSSFLQNANKKESPMTALFPATKAAIAYLAEHSFRDAAGDGTLAPEVKQEMVNLKAKDLRSRFTIEGVADQNFTDFLLDYFNTAMFRTVCFDTLNHDFQVRFGVDWQLQMDRWYTSRSLPAYVIRDIVVNRVKEAGRDTRESMMGVGLFRVSFSVYNTGKADGVLTVNLTSRGAMVPSKMGGYMVSQEQLTSYPFLIRAGEAREIALLFEGTRPEFWVNTNISLNQPIKLRESRRVTSETQDTSTYNRPVDAAYFLPPPGEYIVDNEDAGCHVQDVPSSRRLAEWLAGSKSSGSHYQTIRQAADSPASWVAFTDERVYGWYVWSTYGKKAGRGEATVTWETELSEAGNYELYVSVPNIAINNYHNALVHKKRMSGDMSFGLDSAQVKSVNYYYTVVQNGEETELTMDYAPLITGGELRAAISDDRKWISLGRFRLEQGKQAIRLSDRGDGEYMIQADAAKWVLVSEP